MMETEEKMDQENPEVEPIKDDWVIESPIKVVLGPEGFEHQKIFDDGLGELIFGGGILFFFLIFPEFDTYLCSFQIVLLMGLLFGLLSGGAFLMRSIRGFFARRNPLVGEFYSQL